MDTKRLRDGNEKEREGLRRHAEAVRRAHKHRVAHEAIAADYYDAVKPDASEEEKTEAAYNYVSEINGAHNSFTSLFDRATDDLFEFVTGKSIQDFQQGIAEKMLALDIASFATTSDGDIQVMNSEGEVVDSEAFKENVLEVMQEMLSVPGLVPPAVEEAAIRQLKAFREEHASEPLVEEQPAADADDLAFLEGIDWEADAPEPVRDFDGGLG